MVPNARKAPTQAGPITRSAYSAEPSRRAAPERRTARQGRPSGRAPGTAIGGCRACAAVGRAIRERRLAFGGAPPDNAPRRGEARKGRPPCGTCSPHDAGRGPYAPQRRSARPRSRDLPKTRKSPQGEPPPAGLSRRMRRARRPGRARNEKRPPRARRPALPQPRAAVLSAKAGLTAGFGMGPGDPRLCGRARGGRSPAAQIFEPARSPCRGAPGGRMAGTDRRSRIALGACHRGCEELGLLVPLG